MTVEIVVGPYTFENGAALQKKENIFWKGMKVTFRFFYESPLMIVGILVASVVSQFFFPVMTPTLLVLSGMTFFSKLIIKISNHYRFNCVMNIERKAWLLKKRFVYIQIVSLVVTLVAGYLIPVVGVVFAAILGTFNGLVCEVDYCKKMQDHLDYQTNHQDMQEIINIVSL